MSFQDEANVFALQQIERALPILPQKLQRGHGYTTFAVLGNGPQIKGVIDYVEANVKVGYRRSGTQSLILPHIFVTSIKSSLDIRGATCVGGIVFKNTSKELQKSIKIACLSSSTWGLGKMVVELDDE
jgi:hypothetical protein